MSLSEKNSSLCANQVW